MKNKQKEWHPATKPLKEIKCNLAKKNVGTKILWVNIYNNSGIFGEMSYFY
jgi:hypothetical protein